MSVFVFVGGLEQDGASSLPSLCQRSKQIKPVLRKIQRILKTLALEIKKKICF